MNASPTLSFGLLLLGTLTAGCAAVTLPPRADLPPQEYRRVSSAELRSRGATDLYVALQQCRPRFLQSQRGGSHPPVAYLDGVRLVDLFALRSVHPREVAEVEFLSASEATTLFGTDHMGGAILISTRRGARGAGTRPSA